MKLIRTSYMLYLVLFCLLFSLWIPVSWKTNTVLQQNFLPCQNTQESAVSSGTDNWVMFSHDLQRSGVTSSLAVPGRVTWVSSTGSTLRGSPAVVDGSVYFGSDDGKIFCLNAVDGSQRWNYSTGGSTLISSPAVVDGAVYIGANNKLFCIDATTGAEKWNYSTGNKIWSSPAVADGCVYFGSFDKKVYCLNVVDGSEKWSTLTTGSLLTSSPVVSDGFVYIASNKQILYCLYASNGNMKWTYQLVGNNTYFSLSPAVHNGYVYVGSGAVGQESNTNKFYRFDGLTGHLSKTFSLSAAVESNPAFFNGRVYFGCYDKKIYCVDETSLQLIWRYETGEIVSSSPSIADGLVYVGSKDNHLYCLDAVGNGDGTTSLIWKYNLGGWMTCSPAIVDGYLYSTVQSTMNNIYCFGGGNLPPATPSSVVGPTTGFTSVTYSFTADAVADPEGDPVWYQFDWDAAGSHEYSEWHDLPSASHVWVDAGAYHIRVRAKDRYGLTSDWSLSSILTLEKQQSGQITCSVSPSAVVENNEFVVFVTLDGAPVTGAQVTFLSYRKETDSNGNAYFTAPPVSEDITVRVTAAYADYAEVETVITVLHQVTQNEEKGWIFGVVTDTTGSLVEDVSICVVIDAEGTRKCLVTDELGRYNIQVPVGTYRVEAEKQGYYLNTQSDVLVQKAVAIEVSFVLDTVTGEGTGSGGEAIDIAIQYGIERDLVKGEITLSDEQPNRVTVYDKNLNIEIVPTAEKGEVLFRVAGPDGYPGTIVALKIGNTETLFDTPISDLDELVVLFDGEKIAMAPNLGALFNSPNSTDPLWAGLVTDEEVYVLVFVPHFSEHLISISAVAQALSGMMIVLVYILCSIVAGLVVVGPRVRNIIRRELYLRLKR